MATSEKRQKLFGGFNRLRDFPLDASALYDTKSELEEYISSNKTAFEGQLVAVKRGDGQGIYRVLFSEDRGLHLGEPLATGEDMIHAFEEIASLHDDIASHDARILSNLEWIRDISESYATKSELEGEIRKVLGADYNSIKDELNSIYELSEELDRVLVLLYEGLNGQTYSDIVSAVLTSLTDIRELSARLDSTASIINGRIDSDEVRLAALEDFKNHMTDQHILDVVNTVGLDNIEYKETFYYTESNRFGSFTYGDTFVITSAMISIDRVEFVPNNIKETYTIGLKIANSNHFITEKIELSTDERDVAIGIPLINKIPDFSGKIEVDLSENIREIHGMITINYTRVPN